MDYALYFSAEMTVKNNLVMKFVLSKHLGVLKEARPAKPDQAFFY